MTVSDFINKWRKGTRTERSASQEHFLDLCEVFEHPKPAEADPSGESFTFERGALKHGGGRGWADVWKRGFFGWEYKGKHKGTRLETLRFPGSTGGPWARYVQDADTRGIGTVHYPRLTARDDESAQQLARRTLTNLYNQRPTWLDLAHRKLDEAVAAAYGWNPSISDADILARLLELNLQRQPAQGKDTATGKS